MVQLTGPFAPSVLVACQTALVPGSTFATTATPSPTSLPELSLNFTWIVYTLGSWLWLTMVPDALGCSPFTPGVHAVTLTSFAALFEEEQPAKAKLEQTNATRSTREDLGSFDAGVTGVGYPFPQRANHVRP